ncbi:MAG: arginine--tRNA ligase, partial [Verrucomicrobia bacterium]|nr:arginine--tRNA ligase [Cytophagales bacterium]
MTLTQSLQQNISQALHTLFSAEIPADTIQLQATKADFEGSHTFVTFSLSKTLRKSPQQIGNQIGDFLITNTDFVSKFNAVQGFLNLTLADAVWLKLFEELAEDEDFGFQKARNETVMVEYSSPNTNKPLHLGHLRNNFLGFAV